MPQRFFITHSWKDIGFARKLCNDLIANGLDGFLDAHSMSPGDSIPSRIERGLQECDLYIPIFSPDALKSDWCDWEIDMAIVMNRTRKGRPRIIPVIAKPCDVPDRLIHVSYVSFIGRYDDALNELLTKGFGLQRKLPDGVLWVGPPTSLTFVKSPSRESPLPTAPKIAGMVGAFVLVVVICLGLFSVLSNGVSSIATAQTATPTMIALATPTRAPEPTVILPTSTAIPTMTPKPTDTPLPTATFTPKPTDTPRPTATPTPWIGLSKISPIDGAQMMFVPAGEFTMGSNDGDSDEKPPHPVTLDEFWIDKFEATNALYKKCVAAGKCQPPNPTESYTRDAYYGNSQFDNYPVIYVSWNDATRFCEWAGRRLPTEAEWEKAARGTDGRIYPWGNTFDNNRLISFEGKFGDSAAVGSYPSGASPYGVMDMAGNVWEWIADWYGNNYYSNSPKLNPPGPTIGERRGLRGGAWSNKGQDSARVANRDSNVPDDRYFDVGFRCAASFSQ